MKVSFINNFVFMKITEIAVSSYARFIQCSEK